MVPTHCDQALHFLHFFEFFPISPELFIQGLMTYFNKSMKKLEW